MAGHDASIGGVVGDARSGDTRTVEAAGHALAGSSRGFRRLLPFLGPAFIACVAYVDPGNFATNIAAGSKYGYTLVWVIVASNLMAMLIQSLSAKLGIATGRNLAEVCRDQFPASGRLGHVGPLGAGGHGDRPGRVPGRGAGLQSALSHPALAGRHPDRHLHLPDPRAARARLPAAGGGHHRVWWA